MTARYALTHARTHTHAVPHSLPLRVYIATHAIADTDTSLQSHVCRHRHIFAISDTSLQMAIAGTARCSQYVMCLHGDDLHAGTGGPHTGTHAPMEAQSWRDCVPQKLGTGTRPSRAAVPHAPHAEPSGTAQHWYGALRSLALHHTAAAAAGRTFTRHGRPQVCIVCLAVSHALHHARVCSLCLSVLCTPSALDWHGLGCLVLSILLTILLSCMPS